MLCCVPPCLQLSATAGVKPLDRFTGDAWVVSGALLASNELVSQQNFLQVGG